VERSATRERRRRAASSIPHCAALHAGYEAGRAMVTIPDDGDFARHIDYIHYNPIKHGYVSRVSDWPHSSFHKFVGDGLLPLDWAGDAYEMSIKVGEP
jgi:hypothetical protein